MKHIHILTMAIFGLGFTACLDESGELDEIIEGEDLQGTDLLVEEHQEQDDDVQDEVQAQEEGESESYNGVSLTEKSKTQFRTAKVKSKGKNRKTSAPYMMPH